MSLNVKFGNCIDFINSTKAVVASDPTAFQNIYMEEAIIHAECDLMEMELTAAMDAEKYDFLISANVLRKGNNRKAKSFHNISWSDNGEINYISPTNKAVRLHVKDRKHGKPVPQSEKKWWDEQSGTFYRWDEKRKTFNSHKKPKVHRGRKTFRDRMEIAAKEREIDFLSAMEICDKSNAVFFQAEEETDPIRKEQLKDIASNLLNAGCVDFYYGVVTGHKGTYFPDLAVGV